jgi:hypothetical protein
MPGAPLVALPIPAGYSSGAFDVDPAAPSPRTVGYVSTGDVIPCEGQVTAAQWMPGLTLFTDLGPNSGSWALGTNDVGEVVGYAKTGPQCHELALYWPAAGAAAQILPSDPAWAYVRAEAINNRGEAVGYAAWPDNSDDPPMALRWTRDGTGAWNVEDLNATVSPGLGWQLRSAADVKNDDGWIVGWGVRNGKRRAFLLVPLGPCPWDVDRSGVVDVNDLVQVNLRWGPCPDGAICWADINGDGIVNVEDLVLVIQHWGEICSQK